MSGVTVVTRNTMQLKESTSEGPKSELQHTRKTLGTLSWLFKGDDYSIVNGNGSPCGNVSSH